MPDARTDTLAHLWAEITGVLAQARLENPRREARLLLQNLLQLSPGVFWDERHRVSLTSAQHRLLIDAAARRSRHEPLSRIMGQREFWGVSFALSPDTLDPRPDSETVIEALLAHKDRLPALPRLLDLGVGSGCLLLAALSVFPQAQGIGADYSAGACAAAAHNARQLSLAHRAAFLVSDWDSALSGCFDAILSNPPYIPTADCERLDPAVRLYDPRLALDGGTDGLDAYRILLPLLVRRLKPGGMGILEIGAGQRAAVAHLSQQQQSLNLLHIHYDIAGIERVLVFEKTLAS